MRVKELLSHVPVPSKILRYFEGYTDLNYRNKEYANYQIYQSTVST